MKILTTLAIGVSIILVCGCSKPITGQIFAVSQAGTSIPLAGVEIEVIKAKDADAFIQQRQSEIADKFNALKQADCVAATNYADALRFNYQAQLDLKNAEISRGWTNNANYASLGSQKSEYNEELQKLYAARDLIHRQLGRPMGAGDIPRIDAIDNALIQNDELTAALGRKVQIVDSEGMRIKNQFLIPFFQSCSNASTQLEQACASYNDAEMNFTNYQALDECFKGFSLPYIESVVSDSGGNFILQRIDIGDKIFAKAQVSSFDSSINLFWLVEAPQRGQKLILSNQNLFGLSI